MTATNLGSRFCRTQDGTLCLETTSGALYALPLIDDDERADWYGRADAYGRMSDVPASITLVNTFHRTRVELPTATFVRIADESHATPHPVADLAAINARLCPGGRECRCSTGTVFKTRGDA